MSGSCRPNQIVEVVPSEKLGTSNMNNSDTFENQCVNSYRTGVINCRKNFSDSGSLPSSAYEYDSDKDPEYIPSDDASNQNVRNIRYQNLR
ncbi:hypothetical protein J6590_036295 [Homalodisca vitripennis]|nr:hypothetical protein J6590_036295 [Homalodisca vitripennis]